MAGAVRRALAAAGLTIVAMAVSAPSSLAAVAPSMSSPAVASVQPVNGQRVGVAHPIIVTFIKPVLDRVAAERSVSVTASVPMTGRFEWRGNSVLQWLPDRFWPAHSQISLMAGGVKRNFETGANVLGVASVSAHTFTVSIDGVVMRQMPASMGKPRFATPIGSFTVLGKEKVVVMDSRTIGIPLTDPEGYKITVNDAVRITWGGVYIHSAPWSVGSQGYANVSHGCINLSPDNAAWYFNQVGIGDPVVVRG